VKYTAIRSEGGLLPYDLLDEILAETAPGQKAADFGLPKGRRVSDEIQRVWLDAQELWSRFKVGREKLTDKDPHGTTLTRDRWIGPLLTDPVRLSYDLHYQPSAPVLDGLTFPISHRAGEASDSSPVHIEGCGIELDKRPQKYRVSPQAMVQEFLNRGESLWGVVTNGLRFRLLRNSVRTARPTYLEFDLETILEGGHYNEFVLFYRLCHRTRLPQMGRPPEDCLLETYYRQSIEKGGRVRDNLRDGVEEALKVLGTGFMRHPDNTVLLERIDSGKLHADQYHRQLLLLVYRLLFLTVAEDRHLVVSIGESAVRNQTVYQENYSIGKLRERAEGSLEDSGFSDLWVGLTQTFKLFADSNDTNPLGIPPLNGDLFSHTTIPDLEAAQLSNLDLLKAMRWLMFYRERNVRQRVNYAALDVEELGSVYESLLDFRPIISIDDGRHFSLGAGGERRSTGSYYTRPELVRELIQSALVPVLEGRLAEVENQAKGLPAETVRNAKVKAVLGISVCDPACGSGHFLLEAARRLGKELARIRVGEDEPTPEQFHVAVRDVISHCIHGVDMNPLAVDLCKLALWLEGHWAGKPLSFLDHRIRCGNSLIGVLDPAVMVDGIPDDAFSPVTGDDKKVAAAYKKRNKAEKALGQKRLDFEESQAEHSEEYAELFGLGLDFAEDKPSDVRRKAELFSKARSGADWWHDWTAANLWTASFFVPLTKLDDPLVPTQDTFLSYFLHHKDRPQLTGAANSLASELRFFHWRLEFPDVFERGGFDIVLGNPPWERIKLQEEEHWAEDPYIATATTKAERTRRIEEYRRSSDRLKLDKIIRFDIAKHAAEATSKFARASGRFALTAAGDINTYALFAELGYSLLSGKGRAGVVLPTGIATDDSNKEFFGHLIEREAIVRLTGFENEAFIFPDVHNEFKFCALTLTGVDEPIKEADFTFLVRHFEQIAQAERHFILTKEIIRTLNPNTKTCPVFRTKVDAKLTLKIYRQAQILVNESTGQNQWGVEFLRMFDLSNDSSLFQSRAKLAEEGFELRGNIFTKDTAVYLPLYEAKMIGQFDHRFASLIGDADTNGRISRKYVGWYSVRYQDAEELALPQHWIKKEEVEQRLGSWKCNWLLCFRDITNNVVARTAIFAAVPRVGIGNSAPVIFISQGLVERSGNLLANFNSLIFDYIVRQKLSGTHLNYFLLKQLPVLAPDAYDSKDTQFLTTRVCELTYVAPDVKAFNDDLGCAKTTPHTWNEARRAEVRAELDAYFAHLYRISREELRYVLDPKDVFGADFPGETFRVLKEKEEEQFGEYRTRRLTLAAFDELSNSQRFRGETRECSITGKTWTAGD
jgi:type I restriction-modification system DNA methylase subunit